MPINIEHVVTEVITEPDPSTGGDAIDKRWTEQLQLEAHLKQSERYTRRLRAEDFDD